MNVVYNIAKIIINYIIQRPNVIDNLDLSR